MLRIDLVTALRRSLSRSARSNFSNGIGLACSVESVSADGMDCIRDDRIGQPLRPRMRTYHQSRPLKLGLESPCCGAGADRRFESQKRSQNFLRTYNETIREYGLLLSTLGSLLASIGASGIST